MSTQHVTLIQVFTIGWEQIKKVNEFPNQALFSFHLCNSDHIYSNHEKDVRVCFFPQTKWQLFRGCKLAPEILISAIYTYIHFHLFSGFILKAKIMTNWYFVRIKLSNLSPYKYGAFWHVFLFFLYSINTPKLNMSEKVEKSSTTSSSFEEKGQNNHIEVTDVPFVKSEAEKRLVRKLNTRLLPLAGLIIFLQVLDVAWVFSAHTHSDHPNSLSTKPLWALLPF